MTHVSDSILKIKQFPEVWS